MKKKFCLITGGNGFLGSRFCKFFSSMNYYVISIDKNFKKSSKLNKFSNNITKIKCDITNETEVKNLISKFKTKKIELLINNAAIDAIPKSATKSNLIYPDLNTWKKEIDVSIIGSFLMIKHFGSLMNKRKFGSIINIGSDLSVIAPNQKIYKESYKNYKKPPKYSVIKHGLVGLTKYYASLYAENNVRVNMVSTGPVLNKQSKSLIKELIQLTPMNKLNKPQNLTGILNFLASEESSFITGQNIIIDGGRTII